MLNAMQEKEIFKIIPLSSTTAELTVLLPVFNGAQYITEAVESILAQTYTNFELLLINDGSTDKTQTILEDFAERDARVKIVSHENLGLITTLNQGLLLSSTDLIVRMDADDVALPSRLERQVAFMATHPDVDVCGTGLIFYETGEEKYLPEDHNALQALALFNTPVFHPTVILRRTSVLTVGGYSPTSPCAEDYDLWERMLHAGYRFANLPETLLRYRIHPQKNRAKYYTCMAATSLNISARQLERLGLPVDRATLAIHRICCAPCQETQGMLCKIRGWLQSIDEANKSRQILSEQALRGELTRRQRAFSSLSMVRQPGAWFMRHLRHAVHRILRLGGQDGSLFEGYIAFWWWELKHRLKGGRPLSQ